MRDQIVRQWIQGVEAERARTTPPPGFPDLPEIPGGRYTDPEFFALERDALWTRSWLYAGHVDQLAVAGDYIIWEHGSAPIVLIRGDDGDIRAFYNTCRHRGAPVLRDSAGRAPKRIVCGYHGWTYDRSGELQAVSEPRDWGRPDATCRNLLSVRCEQFGNWVFVCESPNAPALADFLEPLARHVHHLPLHELRLVHRSQIEVAANVKILLENFLEAYHFNLLHANTTHRIFDNRGTSIHLWKNGHSMMLSPFRREGWVDPGTVGMTEMENVTDIERYHNPSYCVFPNLILPISPSGIPAVAMWPKSIASTSLEVLWFAPAQSASEIEAQWQTRIANFDRIVEEDIQFAEPIQHTLNSPGFTGVPLSYQERRIYHWHEALDRSIGEKQVPEALRVMPRLEPFIE